MSIEDKPELLDINGSESILEYNPIKNVLVYAVGCMLVYWELSTDKKVYLKYHECDIAVIKFSICGNFLISVDKADNPCLVMWSIPNLSIFFQNHVPLSVGKGSQGKSYTGFSGYTGTNNTSSIQDIFITFLNENYFIIIINIDDKQKIFYFEFKKQVNLIFDSTLEIDSMCLGVDSFHDGSSFATIESKTIKFWKIVNMKLVLSTKVQTKQRLLENSLNFCRYLKLIVVLSYSGPALILDEVGNFLVYLDQSNEDEAFTSAIVINEHLYLGGDKGTVYLYNLNGFNLINMVNYDTSYKSNFLNNKLENNIDEALNNLNNNYSNNNISLNYHTNESDNKDQNLIIFKKINDTQSKSKYDINSNGPSISNICVSGKYKL